MATRNRQNLLPMIQEFFSALFKAGLPVGVTAYLLVWWALRNGYLSDVETVKDVELQVKRLRKDKEGKKSGDPVHRKWLALGGGFYGVVALLTLIYIELTDILGFIRNFDGFASLAELLSISTLVGIFIETLTNTFMALAWPAYWLSDLRVDHAWMWFAIAYGGYWIGSHLAAQRFRDEGRAPAGPE